MGKNNQKNFITQQIQQNGEYWVAHITPENIQKNVKRIAKEMANGKINYEQVGQYFLDHKFIDNLIIGFKNELEINTLYFNAVILYKEYCPQYPNIVVHINKLHSICNAYNIILDRLYMVEMYNNIGYLTDLSSTLLQYRNYLN